MESLCCTPETNILYANYNSTKKKRKKYVKYNIYKINNNKEQI